MNIKIEKTNLLKDSEIQEVKKKLTTEIDDCLNNMAKALVSSSKELAVRINVISSEFKSEYPYLVKKQKIDRTFDAVSIINDGLRHTIMCRLEGIHKELLGSYKNEEAKDEFKLQGKLKTIRKDFALTINGNIVSTANGAMSVRAATIKSFDANLIANMVLQHIIDDLFGVEF